MLPMPGLWVGDDDDEEEKKEGWEKEESCKKEEKKWDADAETRSRLKRVVNAPSELSDRNAERCVCLRGWKGCCVATDISLLLLLLSSTVSFIHLLPARLEHLPICSAFTVFTCSILTTVPTVTRNLYVCGTERERNFTIGYAIRPSAWIEGGGIASLDFGVLIPNEGVTEKKEGWSTVSCWRKTPYHPQRVSRIPPSNTQPRNINRMMTGTTFIIRVHFSSLQTSATEICQALYLCISLGDF